MPPQKLQWVENLKAKQILFFISYNEQQFSWINTPNTELKFSIQKFQLDNLQPNLLKLDNKFRFILEVVNRQIIVNN